ncbi:MAG: hypothetical protein ABI822_09660 [Bryobacteraceae bacterium]
MVPILRNLAPWMAGFCVLFALDAAMFRTSFYRENLEPDSYAGQVERMLRTAGNQSIAVMGDSRIAEGFSARIADQRQPGFRFLSAAVPGSTPRCWYYLLRELDPAGTRFKTIALPLETYEDADGSRELTDRVLDLNILAARLRLADTLTFASSFQSSEARWNALLVCLLKGVGLREDFQAFLAHPAARLDKAAMYRRNGNQWNYDYQGNSKDLTGAVLPAPVPRGPSQNTGVYTAYRREWVNRIINKYRGTGTSIVFLRLPRGPVPTPASPRSGSSIHEWTGVSILPEDLFHSLETPEYFFDALHLNARGRQRFSTELADILARPR